MKKNRMNLFNNRSFFILWFVILVVAFLGCNNTKNINSKIHLLPPELQSVREKVKHAEFYGDAVDILTGILGKSDRNVGCMNQGVEWDIEGGILTCRYIGGVSYSKAQGQDFYGEDSIFLIETENRVDENIESNYFFFDMQCGDRNIGMAVLFELKEGKFNISNIAKGGTPCDNFFLDHLSGTYTVHYQPGIHAQDLLENIASGTILARIDFKADDNGELYSVYFGVRGRGFFFKTLENKDVDYKVAGFWKNYYYKLKGPRQTPSFETFKEKIRTATEENAYDIIRKAYGDEQRIIRDTSPPVSQWDVNGGILSHDSGNGVYFEKNGQKEYLIETYNKVGDTLLNRYTIAQRDQPTQRLGFVDLNPDGRYKSLYFSSEKDNNIYFLRNPRGTYKFKYQAGIKPDDNLEDLKEGTILGEIIFTSMNEVESFYIYIHDRHLFTKPVDDVDKTYVLFNYWCNFYGQAEKNKEIKKIINDWEWDKE